MLISESKFLEYKQCPKSLSLTMYSPGLKSEDSDVYLLKTSYKIEKLARKLFPNGVEIKYKPLDFTGMTMKTYELMHNGVKTIYGATFRLGDFMVIVDILHYDEGWHSYNIKSGSKVIENQKYLDSSSFQMYVINYFISDLESVNIITLNRAYRRSGDLIINELFKIEDISEEAVKNQTAITATVRELKLLDYSICVRKDIGAHCYKYDKGTSECVFKDYCWSDIPNVSVFDLKNARGKQYTLYDQGIVLLEDIPENTKLTDKQKIQVSSYLSGKNYIDVEQIRKFMIKLNEPLYFLDFESINPAIPIYDNTSPYDQVPFQYSLHIMANGTLEHKEFLAEAGVSPRRSIAESLVEDIPFGATTVAYYMAYEKARLKELSSSFDDLSDHLMSIHDNMHDLYEPFNNMWYYTPEMKGSASIKSVLPALFPKDKSINYKNLNIQNGTMAMRAFETLHLKSPEEIKVVRRDLLAYCKLDTLAMVKIYEKLMEV